MTTPVDIDALIRSRRKTIALEVTEDARVVVRAPRLVPKAYIDRFLREKQHWIIQKKAQMLQRLQSKPVRRYQHGEEFLLFGERIPLVIDYAASGKLCLREGAFCLSAADLTQPERAFEQWYRYTARRHFAERVEHFAAKHGLHYTKLRLSSAQKRWGSCSSTGTISLSWRLIMAPEHIIDYVIVHELAHTRHLDHSAKFWGLVEEMMPDYKPARAWLRREGHVLCL